MKFLQKPNKFARASLIDNIFSYQEKTPTKKIQCYWDTFFQSQKKIFRVENSQSHSEKKFPSRKFLTTFFLSRKYIFLLGKINFYSDYFFIINHFIHSIFKKPFPFQELPFRKVQVYISPIFQEPIFHEVFSKRLAIKKPQAFKNPHFQGAEILRNNTN